MAIPGNLLTTAMGVMPHTDVDRALEMALSLDIPFWPQLPLYSYYEDMYVQASEHFPGILLDMEKRTLRFSMEKFMAELEETMAHFEEPEYFDISPTYSVVYHKFLEMDLSDRPAIRGQLEGPISFGFNVVDQDDRPRGVHLCGNPDWDFLLTLDLDILSMDVYSNGEIFVNYATGIKRFLERGGILVWGLVPTNFEPFEKEDMESLEALLQDICSKLASKGIDTEFLISRSLLSPATCCLVNPDKEKTVEKAFKMIKELCERLKQKYGLTQ